MTIHFDVVTDIEQFFEDFRHMAVLHHKEIDLFGLELGYSEKAYKEFFDDNRYALFKCVNEDKLLGYAGFFVYNPPQHPQFIHAKQDIFYLTPELRGQGIGTQFVEYCDSVFKEMGVTHVLHSVPAQNDWSILLERIGYHKLETVYSRRI